MTDGDRSDLTAGERELVGSPGDLVTEEVVPAREPAATVLVSLRLDRPTFDGVGALAERRGATFSNVARDALRVYVLAHGATAGYPDAEPPRAQRRVAESRVRSWDDIALRGALDEYEAECRAANMREKAWRSYVDYARRFLAWREGGYHPRGEPAGGRPVPRTPTTTAELRNQARLYIGQVQAAGREQPTIDTYFRHAMFFIRWLEGDFVPGARLRGLR